MPGWPEIFASLREDGILVADDSNARSIGGGDISSAWRIDTGADPVFVKTGGPDSLEMFEAEAEGLRELDSANAIRVPEFLACGVTDDSAYLAIEWISFGQPASDTEQLFGRQLAALHRHSKDKFGWHRDNTIGRTPQHNDWSEDWIEFFRDRRLGYQLQLASKNGFGGELQSAGKDLSESLGLLFGGYKPSASLLHGDLWGGNWAAANGQPVIFDPAVYYGDRESDIAMTRLFGGFGPDFYAAYQAVWPMDPGYDVRLELYQLYHVLNHLNLFGGSYFGRATQLMRNLNQHIAR